MNYYVPNSKRRWILSQVLYKVEEEQMIALTNHDYRPLKHGSQFSAGKRSAGSWRLPLHSSIFPVFILNMLWSTFQRFSIAWRINVNSVRLHLVYLTNWQNFLPLFFWLLHPYILTLFSCLFEVPLMHFGLLPLPKTILPSAHQGQIQLTRYLWNPVLTHSQMTSPSLKSVSTCSWCLNKTCVVIQRLPSPKGSGLVSHQQTSPHSNTVSCFILVLVLFFFTQGLYSVSQPHRLKTDLLKQEEAGSYSRGSIHTGPQTLLWSRVPHFTRDRKPKGGAATQFLCSVHSFFLCKWSGSSFSSEGKSGSNQRGYLHE